MGHRLFRRRSRYFGRRRRLAPRFGVALAVALAATVGLVLWRVSSRPAGAGRSPEGARSAQATRSELPLVPTTIVPSQSSPYRVLMIGDSLGEDLGAQLVSQWANGGTVSVDMAAQGDTGLVNQAYYDWPVQLGGLLSSTHAQLVVAMFAANDEQGIALGGTVLPFGSPAWQLAYAQRVSLLVTEATGAGAHVLWVGEPAMQDPNLNAAVGLIDGLDRRVVSALPGALYLDPDPTLSPGGQFTVRAPGPIGGASLTRTPDGVHLTAAGAGLLATAAAQIVAAGWRVELP